jgi:hypothetical protein
MAKAPTLTTRIAALDLAGIAGELDAQGFATAPGLLSADECAGLVSLFGQDARFRSHIVMQQRAYGSGEYKYMAYPLPRLVETLRRQLYEKLVPIANDWAERLGKEQKFPSNLDSYLKLCEAAGQTRPTPLLLRYRTGDYNRLHQDLYGDLAFPLQVTFCLSRLGADFSGGEFLLVEQRPRVQLRGEAVTLDRGDMIVFANGQRPVNGARGPYRVNLRHGVSRLHGGERFALGIIFHDAA